MAHQPTLIDILALVFGMLFGLWVLFPLIALENVLGGRGKLRRQVSRIPRNLLIFWSFFLLCRLALLIRPMKPLFAVLPEPANTYLFFAAGAACLALWWLVERRGKAAGRPAVQAAAAGTGRAAGAAMAPAPYCPKCGEQMVVRVAKQGPRQGQRFYGCPNFPDCRETQALQ